MLTENDLAGFYGSENFYRHAFGNLIYTDGIRYMAIEGNAYWLIDVIASYQSEPVISKNERLQDFQLWELKKVGKGGVITCREDSDIKPVITQELEFADFPFDIKLYVENGTLLLPSEH